VRFLVTEKQALSIVLAVLAQIDWNTTSSEDAARAIVMALKDAGMTLDPALPRTVRARKPTPRGGETRRPTGG
jgi:hypothetical protein